MRFDWIPRERVGILLFEASIEPYVNGGTLIAAPFSSGLGGVPGWDRYTYPMDDDIEVYAENGRIVNVTCYGQCVLHGTNLIGLDYETVRNVIGCDPTGDPEDVHVIDETKTLYEFEQVGASVWIRNGTVESIDCDSGK